LENLRARRRGTAEIAIGHRQEELLEACRKRNWPAALAPNGRIKLEHNGADVNPVLELLRELRLSPLEVLPSPNALEETFLQALETSHGAA